ncbi:MAG: preprotein translocase subunit SecG [Rhodospirillales bacterium]
MLAVLLTIHIMVAIGLVGIILVQRSEGGALGIGGSGGMGGFLAGRQTANLLTRTTAILAAVFILTSLGLARLAGDARHGSSLFTTPAPVSEPAAPAPASPAAPTAPAPESPSAPAPAAPAAPSAPIAR